MSDEQQLRSRTVYTAQLLAQSVVSIVDHADNDREKLAAIEVISDTYETLCRRVGVNQRDVRLSSPRKLQKAAVAMATLSEASNVKLTGEIFRSLSMKESRDDRVAILTNEVEAADNELQSDAVDSPIKAAAGFPDTGIRQGLDVEMHETAEHDAEERGKSTTDYSNYSHSSAGELDPDDLHVIRVGQAGRSRGAESSHTLTNNPGSSIGEPARLPTNPESSISEPARRDRATATSKINTALQRAESLLSDTGRRIQGLTPITMGFNDEFGIKELTDQRNKFFRAMLDTSVRGTAKMNLQQVQELTEVLFIDCMGQRLLRRIRRLSEQVNNAEDFSDQRSFQDELRTKAGSTRIAELSAAYQLIATCSAFELEKRHQEMSDLVYLTNLFQLHEIYNGLQDRLRRELLAGEGETYQEAVRTGLVLSAEARSEKRNSMMGLPKGQDVQSTAKRLLLSDIHLDQHNRMNRQLTYATITHCLAETYGSSALITFPWNFPPNLSRWGVGDGREGQSLSVVLKVLNQHVPVFHAQAKLLNHHVSEPYEANEIIPLAELSAGGSSERTFTDRIVAAADAFSNAADKFRKAKAKEAD